MPLVDDVGCWARVPDAVDSPIRPALFLDRDGVVVEEGEYLSRPDDLSLIEGAAETIASFNAAAIPVVIVTNQSGVARGYLDWQDFEDVQDEVERQLRAAAGASIDAVFACGYHQMGKGALGVRDHPWRKPNAGMLLSAADRLELRLAGSWIVGDRARDLAAGRAGGLAGGLHVMTGHADDAERRRSLTLAGPGFDVRCADDVSAAVALRELMKD